MYHAYINTGRRFPCFHDPKNQRSQAYGGLFCCRRIPPNPFGNDRLPAGRQSSRKLWCFGKKIMSSPIRPDRDSGLAQPLRALVSLRFPKIKRTWWLALVEPFVTPTVLQ